MYGQLERYGQIGDWLLVRGQGETRRGEILGVRPASGGALYTVRWLDTGGTAIVCPGEDAVVVTAAGQAELDRESASRVERIQDEIASRP